MSEDTSEWTNQIHTGDCFDVLDGLPENSVHAVVTDPPYNLDGGVLGEEWDNIGQSDEFAEWCEEWADKCSRVLKPGGYILAFGSGPMHHRLFQGVEDAGFEMRQPIVRLFSNGHPKALDVSKEIDKCGGRPELAEDVAEALREEREKRGLTIAEADELFYDGSTNYEWVEGAAGREPRLPSDDDFERICREWPELTNLAKKVAQIDREVTGVKTKAAGRYATYDTVEETEPATDSAKEWDGWTTDLKPAVEIIAVGRNRFEGAVAKNICQHGTGALNTEACRTNGRHPSNAVVNETLASAELSDTPRFFYAPRDRADEFDHPTTKPVDLMKWLVKLVTAEDQIVLDPFCGTGTTCKAAKNLSRRWIGIEQDPEYVAMAQARTGINVDKPELLDDDHTPLTAFSDGGSNDCT